MYGWELDHKESWVLKNWCFWAVVLVKILKSPLDCKETNHKGNQSWILGGLDGLGRTNRRTDWNWKDWRDWCWSWSSSTLATWCKELTHWKRPWCWERLKARREGYEEGWDGWMASPTQWTWVWSNSRSWWWTRRLGVLQSVGSQKARHDLATELTNWILEDSFK